MNLDYLAGFFDGEGSITAILRRRKGRPTPSLHFRIVVTNTNEEVIQEFKRQIGSGFVGYQKGGPRRSPIWRWYLSDGRDSLRNFVEKMRGRLVIKARQLDVIDQYLRETKAMAHGNRQLPQEEWERRRVFYARVRDLNCTHTIRATPLQMLVWRVR